MYRAHSTLIVRNYAASFNPQTANECISWKWKESHVLKIRIARLSSRMKPEQKFF
jgi:hypothetical protein